MIHSSASRTDHTVGICGGGNLAHAMASWLASRGVRVNILTRRPKQWNHEILSTFPDGTFHCSPLGEVGNNPEILSQCELVFVAVPRFCVREICFHIKPFLNKGQGIVIVPGTPDLLEMGKEAFWNSFVNLMGLHKVPLICRTKKYGCHVEIFGSRSCNRIWTASENSSSRWINILEELFDTPLKRLSSAWPFLLTNSNPLLHPSRCMSLFRNYRRGVFYDRQFLFYEEWTQEASELYLQADLELLALCEHCPGMEVGKDIIPVLDYYESRNAKELTRKLCSIHAFKGIKAPMILQLRGWIPDLNSRYFTEDIPFGTAPICRLANKLNVPVPTLNSFVKWNSQLLGESSTFI